MLQMLEQRLGTNEYISCDLRRKKKKKYGLFKRKSTNDVGKWTVAQVYFGNMWGWMDHNQEKSQTLTV
jgi:hypothetical protein